MRTQVDTIAEGVTLYPSEEEFSNFRQFINSLEARPELQNQGIVKVNLTRLSLPPVFDLICETSKPKSNNPVLFAHWSRRFTETKVQFTRRIRVGAASAQNNDGHRIYSKSKKGNSHVERNE